MATATATTTTHELKVKPVAKPKRRRCRGETTAIVSAVTPEAEVVPPTPPDSPFRVLFSPSPGMEFTSGTHAGSNGFTKFNSALTAGLLNPMSPPPPSAQEKTRSSPSLFEMMTSEPDSHPQGHISTPRLIVMNPVAPKPQVLPPLDKQASAKQRISDILASLNPGNLFNDSASSDIKLTLSSKDGINVSMNVHRQVLVAHSRFFAVKLSDQWMKQQKASVTYTVEIADCEDVEAYIESLRLMYCRDLRRMLMKEDVGQVLGILKVSTAIGFDAGVLSCLEYLEAAPWNEDEEEKVASLLSKLRFDGVTAGEVLDRVSVDVSNGTEGGENEDIILKLLRIVLEGRDEKARRDMKGLVCKLLRENSSQNYIRKDSLYSACDGCLQLLRKHFLQAAESDLSEAAQIARQADNLQWILDILIDRNIAEDFLKTWASQSELSASHPKVPVVHRFEVSRVTARLFVGIGKGQLLASKDARCLLVRTWLVPFYDDFAWTRRASWGLDRHLIEEGLSNTILTLPLAWQQEIMLAWFDRFLNSDKDCPNIQRGFEVWWRRAFWRRNGVQQPSRLLQIAAGPAQYS